MTRTNLYRAAIAACSTAATGAAALLACARSGNAPVELPQSLADTGLYADIATFTIADGVLPFEPQYPLWTDGAAKRRWIALPPGASVDASDADHWVFPVGTRLWKEFSFERRVETRFMALGEDGRWRFGTYAWSADERGATLAPEAGLPGACEAAPGVPFDIPGRNDCLACHAAGPDTVLGFSALQLSSDRDPLAPHAGAGAALDLAELVRRGLVRELPQRFVDSPPRIGAATPRERAVLGYLHANCGMCHSGADTLGGLGLELAYSLTGEDEPPALATTLERASRFRWPSDREPLRLSRATPELSVLLRRMASRQPLSQMPPLGTRLADHAALDLLGAWLREERAAPTPSNP